MNWGSHPIVSSIKYYNDATWVWISTYLLLVPLSIITIYKFIYPSNYALLDTKDKKPRPSYGDWFFKLSLIPPISYYVIDCILKFLREDYRTTCGSSFMFHHVVSILGLPFMFFYDKLEWYMIGPSPLHAFLIAFPHHKFLNYIYLITIIFFHTGVYREPYKNCWNTKYVKIGISLIETSCVLLWWFNCSNALEPNPY